MKKKLSIEGMSCMHCVKHVHDALMELKGVLEAEVDLKGKSALVVTEDFVTDEQLKSAVYDAGYDVLKIENL